MAEREGKGGGGLLLVALLVVLVGAGSWNYRRNVAAEEDQFRPFASYGDADLEILVEAHRQELEALERRYEAARSRPGSGSAGPLLGQRIDAFEQARKAGEGLRSLGGRIGERQAALRDLEAEQALREAERDRLRVFLRRLLTL